MPALRGYAPSGVARSGRHHAIAVAEDALRLADHFAPRATVRLIGHDWGAVAAFHATALTPDRFSHVVTMAVPHPRVFGRVVPAQLRRSWYMFLFQLPRIAEARLARDDFALIDRLWRDWSPDYVVTDEEMRLVKAGIRDRIGPVLAYYRALRSPRTMLSARPTFRITRVPAIHLHGENDGCVGIECCTGAERFYANGYTLHRIRGAGQFLTREKPDEVATIVTDFLKSR